MGSVTAHDATTLREVGWDRKQSVIANVRYQTPKGHGAKQLKGLLRYIQYRDDRDGHIPQQRGVERWVDHGLGGDFRTVAVRCEAFKSEHVQAFTWVINPNPDLVAFVEEDRREVFVRELTERTLEHFFDARDIETPEFSFAIHRRETTDVFEPGRDNPHAHIILPGTYGSWADNARLPLYMNRNRRENHIDLLHDIAQAEMDVLLQREVGPAWEQRYDALMAERNRKPAIPAPSTPPPQPVITPEPTRPVPEKRSPKPSGPSLDL